MKSKTSIFAGLVFAAAILSFAAHSSWWSFSKSEEEISQEVSASEIMWEDLVPDDFVPPENPYITMSQEEIDKLMDGSDESNAIVEEINESLAYAPTVPELDGQRIKIPGYITPLDFENQSVLKEFLLVPYVGACIHVPPPPANQVLHAEAVEGVKFRDMYEPVWAIGTIHTETVTSDLAESGYRLEIEEVVPYSAGNQY